jgi:cell fate (sporulation/competence/biofilm development) regulator YlbF (YheA/YmcA/DUF963 family)
MSTESEPAVSSDDTDAHDIARELGAAITDLPEYEQFEAAQRAVQADDAVQAKIDEFENVRQEFMLARQTGQASQADVEELQTAQDELHEMPVMAEFLEAKQDLSERLAELNAHISAPLAVDFGGEAGGCCQD